MLENQCVFIRGFRVARSKWILPKRLKAAAGPSPDPGGYDSDSDTEVISIPGVTQVKSSVRDFSVISDTSKFRDPLHLISDYIAEVGTTCLLSCPYSSYMRLILTAMIMQQASDCDKILIHDDDLLMIDGIGHDTVRELLNSS